MTNEQGTPRRRTFLRSAASIAAAPLAVGMAGSAFAQASPLGRRRLGKLEVSSVGLGVQNMSRTYQTTVPYRPEMINIIRTAFDRGVTFYDAAEAYGPHEVERILGEGIAPFRDKVVITSKFGWNIDQQTGQRRPGLNSRPDHVKLVVEGMLKRLRTDRIDLLYQHRVDPQVPIEDVAGAVKELMAQGNVLHWGLSEMGLKTLRRAHAVQPVTAVQNEYSMLWRGPEKEVIPTCEELGIGFVPWSPLGVQFLTGSVDANTRFAPGDIRGVESRFSPENLHHNMALVELVKTWAKRKQATPAQIALTWLMAQKPWIVPIPGTTQMPHMLENTGAAGVRFTPAELTELNAAVAAVEIRGQRLPDAVLAFSGVEAPPKTSGAYNDGQGVKENSMKSKTTKVAVLALMISIRTGEALAGDYRMNPFTLVYEGAITKNEQGKVNIHPVQYKLNGLDISANVYTPPDYDPKKKYPALVVAHPNGGVKEQVAGLYSQRLAEKGYITITADAAYQGASGGQPRNVDKPAYRIEDIHGMADFITLYPGVDVARLGLLGICGGGGYSLAAAQTDKRFKSIATVSMFNSGRVRRNGYVDSQLDTIQERLRRASAARDQEMTGGETLYVGDANLTDDQIAKLPFDLYRQGYQYYWKTHAHPGSTFKYTMSSLLDLMRWDATDHIDLIDQPLLMIAGSKADSLYMTEDALAKANGTKKKELFKIDGATHIETYWVPKYVDAATDKLTAFYARTL